MLMKREDAVPCRNVRALCQSGSWLKEQIPEGRRLFSLSCLLFCFLLVVLCYFHSCLIVPPVCKSFSGSEFGGLSVPLVLYSELQRAPQSGS